MSAVVAKPVRRPYWTISGVTTEVIKYALLFALAFSFFVPFLWMISSALKDDPQIYTVPPIWVPMRIVSLAGSTTPTPATRSGNGMTAGEMGMGPVLGGALNLATATPVSTNPLSARMGRTMSLAFMACFQ